MPKQIKITKSGRRGFANIKISVTSTGLRGYANAVRQYVSEASLAESLDKTRERVRNRMLERFIDTKGVSRYTKYTQTGATEQALSNLGEITSTNGFAELSFNPETLAPYMIMQDKGWKAFTHPQTYTKQTGESFEVEVPKLKGPVVRGHPSGLSPGGRKFLLEMFNYWESEGRKTFEKDRLNLFRKFKKENGL